MTIEDPEIKNVYAVWLKNIRQKGVGKEYIGRSEYSTEEAIDIVHHIEKHCGEVTEKTLPGEIKAKLKSDGLADSTVDKYISVLKDYKQFLKVLNAEMGDWDWHRKSDDDIARHLGFK